MKGVSTALMVLLVVILSVITAIGTYFFILASNLENVRRSTIERGIVAEINEVEFLKQNLHQALDYSFYQSKYDVAGLGGYNKIITNAPKHNNLPYWRTYGDTFMPQYIGNLEDRTLEIYNIYTNSIKTDIIKSEASELTVEKSASSTYASVTAFSDPIKLEKPNLTIEESGTIKEIIQTNIFDQFNVGKVNFVDTNPDPILQTVLDTITDSGLEGIGTLTYHCNPDRYPTDEEVFEDTNGMPIGDAEYLIKDLIKNNIADLENNLKLKYGLNFDIHLSFIDDDIQSEVETLCKHSSGDSDCCYKCYDDAGAEYCCGTWYESFCKFHYFGAARVLVSITDKTKTYAVYDGTTDLRNIKLNFYVVSGNKELINSN